MAPGFQNTPRVAMVSGAGGFVGANLSRRLVSEGHQVHLLMHPMSDPWRLVGMHPKARIHRADLTDQVAVDRVVRQVRPHWIFNLAANGAYSHQKGFEKMVATNVLGTHHLLKACMANGFEAFVHTGSSSEYGYKRSAPPETERIDPNSHYAVTKAAASLFCRFEAVESNLPLAIVRLYSVYGPWEAPERLMPMLIIRGIEGRLPHLVDASVARDFIHVDDVVDAYLTVAHDMGRIEPGEIFNVGSGTQTTLLDLVSMARRMMSVETTPRWGSMGNRSWDTDCWQADIGYIQKRLGWSARLSLAEGFKKTVDWFRSRPEICAEYRRRQRKHENQHG